MTRTTFAALSTGLVVLFAVATGCTTNQEAPPLTGPSEFGVSIGVSITPDVLSQDGASQSSISITARDANGLPIPNVTLRLDTIVNGSVVDFGRLSARTVVTGSDGRATATYTAPPSLVTSSEEVVTIAVTPVGGNFSNASARTASVRLVPPGIVNPPAGMVPAFTSFPSAPVEDVPVLFDASSSRANTSIVSYTWNFGNGETGAGVTASSTYDGPGNYFVTLTIRDEFGRSASTTRSITVSAGTLPTAAFDFSPTDPRVNQPVNFNAARSTATAGRRIVAYEWDFGDGTFGSGQTPSHSYGLARTYTVVLTVTDDTGRTASTSRTVTIAVSGG